MLRWLVLSLTLLFAAPLLAQDDIALPEEQSNSRIVRLIEDSLSGENRRIRLVGIEGLLASDARVAEILVADQDGVWLAIREAQILWSRTALLSGRLEIEAMTAGEIIYVRPPLPDTSLPTAEAAPFSIPELPLSIEIAKLSVGSLQIGEAVMGEAAEMTLEGALFLVEGSLDADLALERLDGAGGAFGLDLSYVAETTETVVDLSLEEPGEGLLNQIIGIDGSPDLALTVKGAGPVEELVLDLELATNGVERITGRVGLNRVAGDLTFNGRLGGRLDLLVSETVRPFFAGQSRVAAEGRIREGGGLDLSSMALETGPLSLNGSLATGADGFLRRANLTGSLGDGQMPVTLPVAGGGVQVGGATLQLTYGEEGDGPWGGQILATGFETPDLRARELRLVIDGTVAGIDAPDARRVTAKTTGTMAGISAPDADLQRALGRVISLAVETDWQAGVAGFGLPSLTLSGRGVDLQAKGHFAQSAFDGDVALDVSRLQLFAGLAGRDLSGAAKLDLEGRVEPLSGAFDLSVNGNATDLALGINSVDNLLAGATRLSGQIVRDQTGLRTRDLRLRSSALQFRSDGFIASQIADFGFTAELADLALVLPGAEGRVSATGTAKGDGGDIDLQARIAVPQGKLLERPLSNLSAGFTGMLKGSDVEGRLVGRGQLGPDPVILTADLASDANGLALPDLDFRVGPSAITGRLLQDKEGLLTGRLGITSQDISALAALFLQDATGQLEAEIDLSRDALGQQAILDVKATDMTQGGMALGRLALDAVVYDAFGVPAVIGGLSFGDVALGGLTIVDGTADARLDGDTTSFDARTRLDDGTRLDLDGTLTRSDAGFDLALTRMDVAKGRPLVGLSRPAILRIGADGMQVATLGLFAGTGQIAVTGAAGEDLDVGLTIANVPLSLADAFVEGLGAEGVISGTVLLAGDPANPRVTLDLAGRNLATGALRAASLPAINIDIDGSGTVEDGLDLAAKLDGPENFTAEIDGQLPLAAGQDMNLGGRLDRFPLFLINRIAGNPGLGGRLDGTFGINGPFDRPRIRFDIAGSGLTADVLRENGVPALGVDVEGSFAGNRVVIADGRIRAARGINFQLSGAMPLSGPGLNIAAQGTLPVSVANVALARSALRADGIATVSARAEGALNAPDLSGTLRIADGVFVAPNLNLRLDNMDIAAAFRGDRIEITEARARNAGGGRAAVTGSIALRAPDGFPADLAISLQKLRYTDADLISTQVDGDLTLIGPLTRGAVFGGRIFIEKAEVAIPDTQAATGFDGAFTLDIRHRNATAPIQQTLARAGVEGLRQRREASQSLMALDLTVDAPTRIFIRGRGLDAELGGSVTVKGTVGDPVPEGQFNLIRGRMNVLGQRLNLTEGRVLFSGDINADTSLTAQTSADGIDARITLEGPLFEPELVLSSVPELPQDEVLARIVFRRGLAELSALQIARLAAATAELAGRSSGSVFEQVRQATGLDDFDFETSEEGTTTLRVGAYISERAYSSIEADSEGRSKISVNLDINKDLSARGSLDSEGNTSVGIFFERDY